MSSSALEHKVGIGADWSQHWLGSCAHKMDRLLYHTPSNRHWKVL